MSDYQHTTRENNIHGGVSRWPSQAGSVTVEWGLVECVHTGPSFALLHCLGGFVISQLYGLERPTADVDVLKSTKGTEPATLSALAGRNSALHKRHKVFIDIVTVASVPERYQSRLLNLSPGSFRKLRLKALERHDLVLAKLEQNADRDREDLKRLALGPGLDVNILRQRYRSELRFQFGRPEREDVTLDLWIAIIEELGETEDLKP